MSSLSPKERALIDAARKGWGPSAAATSAVRAGVAERLRAEPTFGLDAPGPETVTSPATRFASAGAFLRSPLGLASGLAAVGLCALFVTREALVERAPPTPVVVPTGTGLPSKTAPHAPQAPERAAAEIASVSLESLPNVSPELPKPRVTPSAARAAGPAPVADADTIAQEVAIVGAAQRSLRDGSPNEALSTLATHAARFPKGSLREERMALQVLALCAIGDLPKARRTRAELERLAPASSHLQRLSCAAP